MRIGMQVGRMGCALALAALLLGGCQSQQEKTIDAAKKQAAATGLPQQVITVDKNGTTTTTMPTQTQPGTPPPEPGVYYQPNGTAPANAAQSQGAPATQPPPTAGPATAYSGPAPAAGAPAPAAPVQPQDVDIPAGTDLTIRINQSINTKTTPPGSSFDGELEQSYTDANGRTILPRGTPVGGRVVESHNGGHFKGASILELRLTSLTLNGTNYPLQTRRVIRERKGKGKRTAALIGGGSGLGMLIGGLAGGGKGLLIGGLAGAGAGTAGAAFTGNHPVDIPAESVVRFKLADDLVLQ